MTPFDGYVLLMASVPSGAQPLSKRNYRICTQYWAFGDLQQSAILPGLMGCILAGIRPEFRRNWMVAENVATTLERRFDMFGAAFAIGPAVYAPWLSKRLRN